VTVLTRGTLPGVTDVLIRLAAVAVINQEWVRVEEITLTYVVVHIWDDRRLILPTSWFTSNIFENWTRNEASLLGSVELDLDWSVPAEGMREELRAVLPDTPMWDGRAGRTADRGHRAGGARRRRAGLRRGRGQAAPGAGLHRSAGGVKTNGTVSVSATNPSRSRIGRLLSEASTWRYRYPRSTASRARYATRAR
jgi:hypothetical protein